MDKNLARYFFEEVSKSFDFLVSEYTFSTPQLEIKDDINFVFVTFMGNNIAVELDFDEREGDITCIINRVIGGEKVQTYLDTLDERDKNGIRVREYLSKNLLRHGIRKLSFTPTSGLGLYDRIRIRVNDFALLIRKNGQSVLNDSVDVLE